MLRSLIFKRPLSYRAIRGIQISTVFAFTTFVQDFIQYPRAGWTGFALMMIYVGFDNGTTLFRAYHRFLGVFWGLLLGYCLWFLGHIDYRVLTIAIPITIFFAYYLAGRSYSVPTIFTVSTSVIGTGYFDTSVSFTITIFLVDYSICTLIAFSIILVFEHFWFRHYHLMRRFVNDTQTKVITQLYVLVDLLEKDNINRAEWFRNCILLTNQIFELNNLAENAHFESSSKKVMGNEFDQFKALSSRIYITQKGLYFVHRNKNLPNSHYKPLYEQMKSDLLQLKTFVEVKNLTIPSSDNAFEPKSL